MARAPDVVAPTGDRASLYNTLPDPVTMIQTGVLRRRHAYFAEPIGIGLGNQRPWRCFSIGVQEETSLIIPANQHVRGERLGRFKVVMIFPMLLGAVNRADT